VKPRILLVEDNEQLAAGIVHNLEIEGYEVVWVADGVEGLRAVRDADPDLLILDIMLPGMDGLQVLDALRREGFDLPVLILTALGEEADKVRGFRLDADHYVVKPFGLLELLERVRSLMRRSGGGEGGNTPTVFSFGSVEVDTRARTVRKDGREQSLTPKAFDLLLALASNEGRVMSRVDLLREVWGHRAAVVTRTVDSHISELRQKVEDDPANPVHILTVWKVGYRFEG
jgi:two-component system alkaline phosphatase synthesis response regulator PhoP